MLSALIFTPAVAFAWRALTAFAILWLAARPLTQIVWVRGAGAATYAIWNSDGQWQVALKGEHPTYALLLNGSAILGPCIFLIWAQNGRRRYALIDRPATDPVMFRMLRGRLRLEGNRLQRRLEPRT